MIKYNRICPICGAKYFCCMYCVAKNSWKNSVCSIECFREALEMGVMLSPEIINILGSGKMRGELTNGKTITITGRDLSLDRFDCADSVTRTSKDFNCFYVSSEEMTDVVEEVKALKDKLTSTAETARMYKKKETVESEK